MPPTVSTAADILASPDEDHSVQRAERSLAVRDGYRIRLVASEPLVIDPVSVRLDRDGVLWVVEMPDYPSGPRDGKPPAGRIKRLIDDDADGVFDRATLFADGLMFPTGVQPYRNGAFVTVAGQIIELIDHDRDGIADETNVLFEGFATENEQLRANHPLLGPDGLVYVAGGLRGGKVRAVDPRFGAKEQPIDLTRHDFCFDPEGGLWRAIAGDSQYGLTIDDFGRRLGCSNRNPAKIAMLDADCINRDPWLTPRDAIGDVALAADQSSVHPISDAWTTSNLHAGQFSAACGVLAAGLTRHDAGEPADAPEWLLVCEPTGSLVQRQGLWRRDGRFVAAREPFEAEFVASSDDWFRPVDLTLGPAQSVFITDMARAVIEHPDWVPVELKNRPDTWYGEDLGRIWQVSRVGTPAASGTGQPTADVWDGLSSDDPWRRAGASRTLYESLRGDPAAEDRSRTVARLRTIFRDDAKSPPTRGRAAALLFAIDAMTRSDFRAGLADQDPRIRTLLIGSAVRATEGYQWIVDAMNQASDETDAGVATQWAMVLGSSDFLDSLAGSRPDAMIEVVKTFIKFSRRFPEDAILQKSLGAIESRCLATGLRIGLEASSRRSIDDRLLRQWLRRSARSDPHGTLRQIFATEDDVSAETIAWIAAWWDGARASPEMRSGGWADFRQPLGRPEIAATMTRIAGDESTATARRVEAIEMLDELAGRGIVEADPAPLHRLLMTEQPVTIESALLRCLARNDSVRMRSTFEKDPAAFSFAGGEAFVKATAGRDDGIDWLLDAIETGRIAKSMIGPDLAKRWQQHSDTSLRGRARDVFASDPNRSAVLDQYREALDETVTDIRGIRLGSGDPVAGKKLFSQHCAGCHRIDSEGTNVGPDISDSRSKTPEYLLTAILDPNAAIDAAFVQTIVLTDDGRLLDGLLVDESTSTITLLQKGGKRIIINRDTIEERSMPGVSLMPDGFEQSISVDQMADLISYLKNWRYGTGTRVIGDGH